MDIYRKELNQIYASQHLETEKLPSHDIGKMLSDASTLTAICKECVVVTDAASDRCYIFGGGVGTGMGLFPLQNGYREELSSDEDIIYDRIHPEDLVDKRLLEYEFFKFVVNLPEEEKLSFKAVCRIRMKDNKGEYRYIDNSTRLLRLSPNGKMWLILCTYDFSSNRTESEGISPGIMNMLSGDLVKLNLRKKRGSILSEREKEILKLISDGLPSKGIADRLNISIHTVNRHRQNILAKLSVGNSIEAVMAAGVMKLL